MADEKANRIDVSARLAYCWDQQAKRIEKVWLLAINPPSSLRAVANRVAATKVAKITAKALRSMKRRGIIEP
jgi:DNA-directed RNA polymerase sigma subunit (sigma70/sigma32)